MNVASRLLFLITLTSLITIVSAQTPETCEGTNQFCVYDALYDCVNGEPQLVKYCAYKCEEGECVKAPSINPDIAYIEPEKTERIGSDDMILYITVGIVLAVTIILFVRLARRK